MLSLARFFGEDRRGALSNAVEDGVDRWLPTYGCSHGMCESLRCVVTVTSSKTTSGGGGGKKRAEASSFDLSSGNFGLFWHCIFNHESVTFLAGEVTLNKLRWHALDYAFRWLARSISVVVVEAKAAECQSKGITNLEFIH